MQKKPRNDPKRAALVRELRTKTGSAEKSIYRWLNEGRTPRNPLVARAWSKALSAARAKLARVAS
jgi:predicted DNA-binding transcriptional regulator AlpA